MMANNIISFRLNGLEHIVPNHVHPATRLSDYIRQVAQLKGTKVTCREGGCGACVVTVQYTDPRTNKLRSRAINSCLCPVYSLQGCQVTTTEGLGGKQRGYHPIQQRMADNSATQCGWCTPGFVMSMHSLLQENSSVKAEQVEKAMDGNICRCTGYRSIRKALKSFTVDEPGAEPLDIEDLKPLGCGRLCKPPAVGLGERPAFHLSWTRPQDLNQLYQLLDVNKDRAVRLVFGNTGTGVYKKDRAQVYVDIHDVKELYDVKLEGDHLQIGSSTTLTDLMELCEQYGTHPGFLYLHQFKTYLENVANTPIRNAGSWAGNLMLMHVHPEFPSDIYPTLEALGTKIIIGVSGDKCKELSVVDLMKEDMKGNVILSMKLPALRDNQTFNVYRTTARHQSAISYVNLCVKIDYSDVTTRTVDVASIVYTGLSATHHRPTELENAVKGKSLLAKNIQRDCLGMIETLKVDTDPLSHNNHYRVTLLRNLLFKFFCELGGSASPMCNLSAQPVHGSGQRDYETKPERYPITKPIPKLSGRQQAAGETVYIDDMPTMDGELNGLFVLSTIGRGQIDNIDISLAMSVGGAVDVITAADIPGTNVMNGTDIVLLAEKEIEYNGQPIALVLADDLGAAYKAASMVKVTYKNVTKPVVELTDAIERGEVLKEAKPIVFGNTKEAMADCNKVIEGTFRHGEQYHFYMENNTFLAVPSENGLDMWASTQFPTYVQNTVAEAVGLSINCVQVTAPRVGGAFGGKTIFPSQPAAVVGVAAMKTNRPVRLVTSLETSMKFSSHRPQAQANYKVGVDKDRMLKAMEVDIYINIGHKHFPGFHPYMINKMMETSIGSYYFPNVTLRGKLMKSDLATAAPMRSPCDLPGFMIAEHMIEHVARELKQDVLSVKEKNIRVDGQMYPFGVEVEQCYTEMLWKELMVSADVKQRRENIQNFNKSNRWVKKGLAMTPGQWNVGYNVGSTYPLYLAVYSHDGSVVISHGGVEMGQGQHTKVMQVAAQALSIPLDQIKITNTNTLTGPNAGCSGGSLNTELLYRTVFECCQVLLGRLAPFREQDTNKPWKEVIEAAHAAGVHLAVTDKHIPKECKAFNYGVYGVCVAEAEVDILTGENRVDRADIYMDIGESVNPDVDIGQVEGALVLGKALMLHEKEVRSETGELLTANTWDYKPPMMADMPIDLRVKLLKGKSHALGVYSSKALGEPPIQCTPVFLHAVKAAVDASRLERNKTEYVDLYAPATPDVIQAACDVSIDDLVASK